MKRAELRRFGPLLVVVGIIVYQELFGDENVLGTRTMSTIADFKKRLGPVALQVEREKGIKALYGVGQASLESGYGSSQLSSPAAKLKVLNNAGHVLRIGPAHNYFGFTAEKNTYWRNPKNDFPYVLMPTREWVPKEQIRASDVVEAGPSAEGLFKVLRERPFRAYSSPDESYRDWARLMDTQPYVEAGASAALRGDDVAAVAAAFKRARYATDPRYEEKIAGRIRDLGSVA